jgi:hypothetical protein
VLAGEAYMSTHGRFVGSLRSRVCLTASVHGGSTNFAGSLRPTGWVGPGGVTANLGAAGQPGPSGGVSALPPPSVRHASHMECTPLRQTMGGSSSTLGRFPVLVSVSSSNLWQPTSRVGPGVKGSLPCRLRQGGSDARSDAVKRCVRATPSPPPSSSRTLSGGVGCPPSSSGWVGRSASSPQTLGWFGRGVGRCQAVSVATSPLGS